MLKQIIKNLEMNFEDYGKFNCTVPCSMYSVLLENGKIDDPFYRDNEYALTDLFRKNCEFNAVFNLAGYDDCLYVCLYVGAF